MREFAKGAYDCQDVGRARVHPCTSPTRCSAPGLPRRPAPWGRGGWLRGSGGWGASSGAGGIAYGRRRLEGQLRERTTVLMGVMSAFVFAAQMVNFPIGPLPISGHLLGGVLAAVLLGPWAGAGVIGAVLIVQCLLFGDGGLTALGANFINMGLIVAVGGYAIYAPIRRAISGRAGVVLGAMIAAWFSVILAAGAFTVELAASGRGGVFFQVLG